MCFSPKMKTPQINPVSIPEPAPIDVEPAKVEFGAEGGEATNDLNESGRKTLTIDRNKEPVSKNPNKDTTNPNK